MLYHVSCTGGLKKLVPTLSSHGKAYVYAVDNYATGLIFGARHDDFDLYIYDEDGKPVMCECYPDAFDMIYSGKSCSVYELDEQGFMRDVTGWKPELVCDCEVDILLETRIDDLHAALLAAEAHGGLRIFRYSGDAEYKRKISSHIVDRLIRFDMLDRAAADERLTRHYGQIITALQNILDGHLLP